MILLTVGHATVIGPSSALIGQYLSTLASDWLLLRPSLSTRDKVAPLCRLLSDPATHVETERGAQHTQAVLTSHNFLLHPRYQ